jgi:hypothetical protein
MSRDESRPVKDAADDEPFLQRWSRLKSVSRNADRAEIERVSPEPTGSGEAADRHPAAAPDAADDPVLPDLEQLNQDSDYSAFLSPKVDPLLRRKALRKLFHSPKFNVCDGLDDYCDDFTQFTPLGAIVTADMRHHLARVERELAARAEEALARDASPADAPPPVVAHEPEPASTDSPAERNDEDVEHGPA